MIYDLLPENHPSLKEPVEENFDFENPPIDPEELFLNMKETMVAHNGIGLAAPQVGLRYRMFVFGDPTNEDSVFAAFNPKIVDYTGQDVKFDEGCLSYPDLYVRVTRPDIIRARYTSANGKTDTIKFEGMTSRIFQHEYDHLNGICMVNRASKIHLDRARKYRKRIRKANTRHTKKDV